LDEESFLADEKTIDAVVRNLEIIGEAAKQLPADFKARHSAVGKSPAYAIGSSMIMPASI
jgi:uncharacterized protein with HEPN domain